MTVEVNPGTPSTGRLHERRNDPARRRPPRTSTSTNSCGPRRRNARLPAGAAGGRGRRVQGQRQGASRRRSSASTRLARDAAADRPGTATSATRTSRAAIHNFRLLMEAFGDKDKQLADLIQASNAVFADVRARGPERAEHAAAAAGRAEQDRTAGSASSPRPSTWSGRRSTSCSRSPARSAPPRKPRARRSRRPRRSSRTRSARSRAKSCPRSTRSQPEHRRSSPKRSPSSPAASRCSTNSSTSSPTTRARTQAGFLFFLDWDAHNLNSVVSSADAHGALGRTLLYFNCEVLPLLARRREDQPDGQHPRRPAQPADEGGVPERRASSKAQRRRPPRAATAKAPAGGGVFVRARTPAPRSERRADAEMQKRAPTLGNILVIVLFALSCFGLLLFLWESFGGPVPLKPKGYQFTVAFPRALALAEQSDVRISGVDVGHVVALKLGKEGRTVATLEIASQYAPIRADMHAILRQKTLLGETYVQLIPAGPDAGPYLRRRRPARRQPGRTVGHARRHPLAARRRRRARTSRSGSSRSPKGSPAAANRSTPTSPSCSRSSNTPTSWSSILASQEGARDGAGQEHRRRLRRARRTRPPVRRADRQRRAHLPRGRRREPGVRRRVQACCRRSSTTRRWRSKNSTRSPRSPTRSSKNSARPSASCRRCWRPTKPFAPAVQQLPDRRSDR